MKRILLLLACPVIVTTTSCNKSYLCECLDQQRNALEIIDIKASKNSDAESRCAEHNDDPANGRLTNCHLK